MPSIRNWIDEGREEGLIQGMLTIIKRQLSKKIGLIHPLLQKKLDQLSVSQLESLAEALLTFSEEKDLRNWLNGVIDETIE